MGGQYVLSIFRTFSKIAAVKAYTIPVSKAAFKMLKRDFDYRHHMRIDKINLSKIHGSCKWWDKYLNTVESHQVTITVICRYASTARLYNVARLIENTFNQRLLTYIEGAVEAGMPAAEAISRFFDKYDLSEDDMLESTAYKRWQRHVAREMERDFIPLW
jgi:hypothetical protein